MQKIITIIVLIAMFVLLTGCATTKNCEPVIVDRVVSVPCIKTVPKAVQLESVRLPENATFAEQIQAISIDVLELNMQNNELRAMLEGCRKIQ